VTNSPIYEFLVLDKATGSVLGAGTGYRNPRHLGRAITDVVRTTRSRGYAFENLVPECRAVEGGRLRHVDDAEAIARGDAIEGGEPRSITQAEAIAGGGALMEWEARRRQPAAAPSPG